MIVQLQLYFQNINYIPLPTGRPTLPERTVCPVAKILPGGTAFVTDLGMTGPLNSVIGNKVEDVLGRFLTAIPRRLSVPEGGPVQFNSVMVEVDDLTGKALSIQRMDQVVEP